MTREPPSQFDFTKFEYSNLGVGLLGHILSLRANTSYENLVKTRILQPLGMNDTRITLTPGMKARLVRQNGQARWGLFAASETEFFMKVVEASITFTKDESGKVTGLILRQKGDHTGKKIR
jgi:CubicO group peptidase (beta-lactamase class C family)